MRAPLRCSAARACWPACARRATPAPARRRCCSTSPTRTPSRPPRERVDRLDGLVDNAGIAVARTARAPAARGAPPPARGERRRAAGRDPGVPAGSSRGPRAHRHHRLDRRQERASFPRRLRDVEARARGDGRLAARRARDRRHPRGARRAGHDRHADLDEAAAERRRAARRGNGALRRANRLVPGRCRQAVRKGRRRPSSSCARSSTR